MNKLRMTMSVTILKQVKMEQTLKTVTMNKSLPDDILGDNGNQQLCTTQEDHNKILSISSVNKNMDWLGLPLTSQAMPPTQAQERPRK